MKISVIGTGYVGLVTGACFASVGHDVTCLDINEKRIDELQNGQIPFHEPGLKELVINGTDSGKLNFTSSYEESSKNNIYFICVGTPSNEDGSPNLDSLRSVISSISDNISTDSFIYTKSTVPIGTNQMIQQFFDDQQSANNINVIVASNPEFLKEGDAVNDFFYPSRVVLGSENKGAQSLIKKIYAAFDWNEEKMKFMSVESSELTKYASNAFLATKISFMNEMAIICEHTGASIHQVREGMGSDPRIGNDFLYAGLGYGGSCFPKDVSALIDKYKKLDLGPSILEQTKRINDSQIDMFIQKIESHFLDLSNCTLAIWGLSFKPNSDDIRESVGIKMVKKLSPKVHTLNLFDPIAMHNAALELKDHTNIEFLDTKTDALIDVNGLVICTEWDAFKSFHASELKMLRNKIIFDGRNILDQVNIEAALIKYVGIGV
jgi:UDPglucose 6-dehydrogenase|tara:strand:+ start:1147 stop:2451 length:1305 start_codon:yes stop_codon:yes gene_type:complete